MSYVLLSLGRNDEAAEHCGKASDHDGRLGRAKVFQGKLDVGIRLLRGSALGTTKAYLGYALGRVGHQEEALQIAAAGGVFAEAATLCGLGDKERAIAAIGRIAEFGPVRLGRTPGYPEFGPVRDDPRVKALRKKPVCRDPAEPLCVRPSRKFRRTLHSMRHGGSRVVQ